MANPTPNQDGTTVPPTTEPRPTPGRIGAVLCILITLITHARYFTATAKTHAAKPEFACVAAIFGTHDLRTILFRVQRGIRRALALQQYLLERAARGRNLRFCWPPYLELKPHHRRPATPRATPRAPRRRPSRPDPALLGPDDSRAYYMFTQDEFAADVRRRPVGRTFSYIMMDLAVIPGLCDGEFWNKVEKILRRYGGSLDRVCRVRERRAEEFQKERDRRPETWDTDWRDLRPDTVRLALGCKIGEPPPVPVPS